MILKFKENRVNRAYMGGKNIDRFVGKENCEDGRKPEEWIASVVTAFNPDNPIKNEGLSVCENGRFFKDVLAEDYQRHLGVSRENSVIKEMAILVKLLDSAERLVVQCHPTIEFAKKAFNSNFGKTECWYMLDTQDDAHIYLGFKKGITREKWMELYNKQDIDGILGCLNRFKVKKGDLWFVDGGVPHAIGQGCFMIELQEPSYLMVIPEKQTPSGRVLDERKIHGGLGFEKMFDCYEYIGYSEDEIKSKYYRNIEFENNCLSPIVDKHFTEKFAMYGINVSGECDVELNSSAVAVVIRGECTITDNTERVSFKKGDKFFLSDESKSITIIGNAKIVFCSL